MAQIKYFYNSETCQYEQIRTTGKNLVVSVLGLVVLSVTFAVLILFGYNAYHDTEKEVALKKTNYELQKHLTTLQTDLHQVEDMLEELNARNTKIYYNLYNAEPGHDAFNPEGSLTEVFPSIRKNGLNDKKAVEKVRLTLENLTIRTHNDLLDLKEFLRNTKINKEDLIYIPTMLPLENNEVAALYSGFGNRINPFHHGNVLHEGMDFTAPEGTPVIATAAGKVLLVKTSKANTGYGNQVEINHGNGLVSKYAHLSEIIVKKNTLINKGEILGYVGKTGGAIGACLHYEIIKNGKKVNPVNYIAGGLNEKDYTSFLKLAFRENQSMD